MSGAWCLARRAAERVFPGQFFVSPSCARSLVVELGLRS